MSERVTLDESRDPALGELALNDDGVGSRGGLSSDRCSDARLTPEATLRMSGDETTDYSCVVRNSSGSE